MGQRQSGKTTLLGGLAKEYVTLDTRAERESAEETAELWIEGRKSPFGIDECQLAPALFPALKESVRQRPERGRFLLSGSVRFTSRRAICESLTGRILNLELLPFGLAESHALPALGLLENFIRKPTRWTSTKPRLKLRDLERYLAAGGLPGICFHRDSSLRARQFESHLETLLDRDLRLVLATKLSYRSLRGFLTWLANNQGEPLQWTEAARQTQISARTLKVLLGAFESLFLVRTLETEGGAKAPVVFMEDQGMASHFTGVRDPSLDNLQDYVRALFVLVFHAFHYSDDAGFRVFQYRSRGGAWVPVAARSRLGYLGVIPSLGDRPHPAALKSADSFVKKYPRSCVLIVCREAATFRDWGRGVFSIPLRDLLQP